MNPRSFLNFLKSPPGALAVFLLVLIIILVVLTGRQEQNGISGIEAAANKPSGAKGVSPQVAQSVERDMTQFRPVQPAEKTPKPVLSLPSFNQPQSPPSLPPISLVAETPAPRKVESKTFGKNFAPYGRLIPCELVITVDSSTINTPIVGLVTDDIFHHGQLIIPAGTEVHGTAQIDRARERIASHGQWTLVWQNGEELKVSGLALDHERDAGTGGWSISDGSAGLRGRLIKSDNLAEVKLYVAALLSGAADVFTEKQTSGFGSFALSSLQNAPLKGAQTVLDRYAQTILQNIERDGFYVRVPAGKQFYLYVTQTVDQDDAKIGGTAIDADGPGKASGVPDTRTAQQSELRNAAPAYRTKVPATSRIP